MEYRGIFNSSAYSYWRERADLPMGLADGSIAVVDSKIYFFGGYSYYNGIGDFTVDSNSYVYDPNTNVWDSITFIPSSHTYSSIACSDGEDIYVWGGIDEASNIYDSLYIYDVGNDSWSRGANFPTTVHSASAVYHDGKIYIMGGARPGDSYSDKNTIYDPIADTYADGAVMLTGRSWFSLSAVGDTLYAIGGGKGGGADLFTGINEAYDVTGNSWSVKDSMPAERWGLCRENAAINGKIYVGFGIDNILSYTSTMYKYNPNTDSWEQVLMGLHKRDGACAAVVSNKLYIAGGRDTDAQPRYGLNYVEEFNP